MRVSINDLLEMLAAEAQYNYEDQTDCTEEDTDEVEMETPMFGNNADALQDLYTCSMTNHDYMTALRVITLANELKITLITKA